MLRTGAKRGFSMLGAAMPDRLLYELDRTQLSCELFAASDDLAHVAFRIN